MSADSKPSTVTGEEEPWSVEAALSQLPNPPSSKPPTSPIPFFHLLERLKTTPRTGWICAGNPGRSESISDHMHRMSIISLCAPAALVARHPGFSVERCMVLAAVHDVAELLVGDITPRDPVSKPEKSRRESATMDFLCGPLLLPREDAEAAGIRLRDAWREYEDGVTPEAVFVHDVDKLELLLQMVEYERAQAGELDLTEFTHVADRIQGPEVKRWALELLAERAELWKALGKESKTVGAEFKGESDRYYSKQ